MTGRTHDLAAFTALNIAFIYRPPTETTLATVVVAVGANMIGGLLPDIDNATADIWDKIRGGGIVGRLIQPLLGKHRMISHSLLGFTLVGFISYKFLFSISHILLVDMTIVWLSLLMGYASHLIMDSFTKQGVPWFLPIPARIGFPPIKKLRIKTGGILEQCFVFPLLLSITGYLIYAYYPVYITFLKSLV